MDQKYFPGSWHHISVEHRTHSRKGLEIMSKKIADTHKGVLQTAIGTGVIQMEQKTVNQLADETVRWPGGPFASG